MINSQKLVWIVWIIAWYQYGTDSDTRYFMCENTLYPSHTNTDTTIGIITYVSHISLFNFISFYLL